jgi:cation diffusion facilitator CzcD-associated flavoprotein CzcO
VLDRLVQQTRDLIDERTGRGPELGPPPRIAVVGAGVGGLGTGIRLKQAGIESFTIYEKSDGVGGTWHDNSYPGAACDVPSHLYSFSFAPKADWSRVFPGQSEILAYLEDCADRFGLRPHLRCGVEITEARWDDDSTTWRLTTREGEEIVADVVVSALGQLNVPSYPDIPGRDEFRGTAFHSARWDHGHDLEGERVAVIGTGASAVQFVPEIAPVVERLSVFQRSPNWIVPRPDMPYPESWKRTFARHPSVRLLHRAQIFANLELRWWAMREGSRRARQMATTAADHLRDQVADPGLRAKLTPDYPVGCKRILISSDYYPALTRDNVEVVTQAIERITADGIVTTDGREHRVDTIVYGTGFHATEFLRPIEVVGRHGVRLHDEWRTGAEAYLGVTVAGFPNLFLLYGPNTNLGHNSIIYMIEAQIGFVLRCLRELRRSGVAALDVRSDVMRSYNGELQASLHETVWESGCHNWYKTETGKVTNNWPRPASAYWWQLKRAGLGSFTRLPARSPSGAPPTPEPVTAGRAG